MIKSSHFKNNLTRSKIMNWKIPESEDHIELIPKIKKIYGNDDPKTFADICKEVLV